jgi:hypothetical protein
LCRQEVHKHAIKPQRQLLLYAYLGIDAAVVNTLQSHACLCVHRMCFVHDEPSSIGHLDGAGGRLQDAPTAIYSVVQWSCASDSVCQIVSMGAVPSHYVV